MTRHDPRPHPTQFSASPRPRSEGVARPAGEGSDGWSWRGGEDVGGLEAGDGGGGGYGGGGGLGNGETLDGVLYQQY